MNLSKPIVTIGVASYNNGKYIRETLESIRQQTYENLELIVVDDGSTDDSVQVIEQWLKNYPELNAMLIRHKLNRGICAVCNTVLGHAKGEYMSIVGSDDVFLPEKTSRQLAELQIAGAEYAVVYSDMYIIDEQGKRAAYTQLRSLEPGFITEEGDIFELEIIRNRINSPSALMSTSAVREVGGYDEKLSYEDWDMWLRLSKIYKVKYSCFISVEYRVLATSAWNKRGKKFYESSIQCLVKQLGISSKTDKLIVNGIAEYAQLLYKLYGRDAAHWLRFAYGKQPTWKLGILSLLASAGVSYSVYNKAARLVSK